MAITGTTTADEALAEYLANVGYAASGSQAMAEALVSAGNALLILRPSSARSGDKEFAFSDASFRAMQQAVSQAQSWLNNYNAGNGHRRVFDLRGTRE